MRLNPNPGLSIWSIPPEACCHSRPEPFSTSQQPNFAKRSGSCDGGCVGPNVTRQTWNQRIVQADFAQIATSSTLPPPEPLSAVHRKVRVNNRNDRAHRLTSILNYSVYI